VTLKSKLWVTEGRWKRYHSIDNIRLTISRVIWCWIISWPWNVGYRSLKVIENGAIQKRGCGFLFAFHSNYGDILYHLRDIATYWRHLATSRESKTHFGLPWVRPWDNRGKCYMDGKRIQCWSNASQHVPIYLQPFPSNPTRNISNVRHFSTFFAHFGLPG